MLTVLCLVPSAQTKITPLDHIAADASELCLKALATAFWPFGLLAFTLLAFFTEAKSSFFSAAKKILWFST